jgi:uncharacterized protein (DUF1697 family)
VAAVPRYAAFVRGINLGRRRRVSGAELCSLFEEAGLEDVATFRTSGNVVFDVGREPAARTRTRIEQGLAAGLGYDVSVLLRSGREMRALAAHQPFAAELVERSKGKLQVMLLEKKPTAKMRKSVLALATDEDLLAFADHELYWLPSGGTRDAGVSAKAVEDVLGVLTMRTKGTIDLMAETFFAGQ